MPPREGVVKGPDEGKSPAKKFDADARLADLMSRPTIGAIRRDPSLADLIPRRLTPEEAAARAAQELNDRRASIAKAMATVRGLLGAHDGYGSASAYRIHLEDIARDARRNGSGEGLTRDEITEAVAEYESTKVLKDYFASLSGPIADRSDPRYDPMKDERTTENLEKLMAVMSNGPAAMEQVRDEILSGKQTW